MRKSQRRKDSLHTGCKGRLILRTAPVKRRYGTFAEARASYSHNGRKVLYTI